jgi:hypothetical protein
LRRAFFKVCVICSCPTTSSNRAGRYFLAETTNWLTLWFDFFKGTTIHPSIFEKNGSVAKVRFYALWKGFFYGAQYIAFIATGSDWAKNGFFCPQDAFFGHTARLFSLKSFCVNEK